MDKRIYRSLKYYDDDQIQQILQHGTLEELAVLPFSVGEYCPYWKKAQDICIKLSEHSEPIIRANAIMGLAYIARTKGNLEKHIVKPLLIKELRNNTEYRWRIIDAIQDINIFLDWNLAKKAITIISIHK